MKLVKITPNKLVGTVLVVDAVWSLLCPELPHKDYMDIGRFIRLICGIYVLRL